MSETTPHKKSPIFLSPGDFWFGSAPAQVSTLLGSCVAIVIWHPVRREGGMCHYLLPNRTMKPAAARTDGRYAGGAFELFLDQLRRRGTDPREYHVKMFGGANMLITQSESTSAGSIATRNVAVGRQLLRAHGFNLSGEHVGGTLTRKILFNLSTGEVLLKQIGSPIS